MSATKDCPGCGRGFLKGKRVLFPMKDGRLVRKLVCLTCGSKAERIITRVSAKPCMVPGCDNSAHVCTHHVAVEVLAERKACTVGSIEALRGIIVAMGATERKHGADDFLDGKLEGLRTALHLLVGRGAPKGARSS